MALVASYEHLHRDLEVVRGQALIVRVTVRPPRAAESDPLPDPTDITGRVFEHSVKSKANPAVRLSRTAGGGVEVVDGPGGVVESTFPRSDFLALRPGAYLHTLMVVEAPEMHFPVCQGDLALADSAAA